MRGAIPVLAKRRGKRSTKQKTKRSARHKAKGADKKKDRQVRYKKMGKEVLGFLVSVFGSANMNLATGHNALFSMDHFIAVLSKMCEIGCAAESATDDLITEVAEADNNNKMHNKKRMPTGKWFRNMINSISEHAALLLC